MARQILTIKHVHQVTDWFANPKALHRFEACLGPENGYFLPKAEHKDIQGQ